MNRGGTIAMCAALSAALAIIAGAFGAHNASSAEHAAWLQTGANYQLVSAVGALVLLQYDQRTSAKMLLIGALIFAGTLYAMALGAPRILGAVTPIGGTLMIAGWVCAAYRFWRQRSEQ